MNKQKIIRAPLWKEKVTKTYKATSRLKTTREKLGISIRDFAARAGMNFAHYWQFESGKTGCTEETIQKIKMAFNPRRRRK
jgi:predicted transcriptional regulator